jgi:hypothetical protein
MGSTDKLSVVQPSGLLLNKGFIGLTRIGIRHLGKEFFTAPGAGFAVAGTIKGAYGS